MPIADSCHFSEIVLAAATAKRFVILVDQPLSHELHASLLAHLNLRVAY